MAATARTATLEGRRARCTHTWLRRVAGRLFTARPRGPERERFVANDRLLLLTAYGSRLLRVGYCRPRKSALRSLNLGVSFPAVRSRARSAPADLKKHSPLSSHRSKAAGPFRKNGWPCSLWPSGVHPHTPSPPSLVSHRAAPPAAGISPDLAVERVTAAEGDPVAVERAARRSRARTPRRIGRRASPPLVLTRRTMSSLTRTSVSPHRLGCCRYAGFGGAAHPV